MMNVPARILYKDDSHEHVTVHISKCEHGFIELAVENSKLKFVSSVVMDSKDALQLGIKLIALISNDGEI